MRIEKIAILDEVIDRVKNSAYCFVINYGGLGTGPITKLRAALRAQNSRLLVVKNTFIAKVAKEQGWPETAEALFSGPTAIVTGAGEVTDVAKILCDFVKDNEKAAVKAADYESKLLSPAEVEALSKLPGKDQMRAMFLSTLNAPATKLAQVLNASMLQVLYALKAKADKEGGAAE